MEPFIYTPKPWYKKTPFILFVVFCLAAVAFQFAKDLKTIRIEDTQNLDSSQKSIQVSKTQWTKVFEFGGNGIKSSANFELSSKECRLKYKYKSDMDIGSFNAYMVKEGVDLMRDGGYPDVMLTASETGETYIHKSEGRYYLSVQAAGKWNIIVEEKK